nr:LOW QUALITY PROTEIN: BTB/POZ domain-containing adapter for CUL3-mediated RhoA degradation protein 2-like [Oncorhynchus nerka]
MSGDSCQLPLHRLCLQTQVISTGSQAIRASQMACPKSKTCSYRAAVGLGNKYVRLNVGGTLFYSTLQVLTRQDSMLKAMFSGRKEVFIDREGWILIDRRGKHFTSILTYLREEVVTLPPGRQGVLELLAEAKYYLIQGLVQLCQGGLQDQKEQSLCVIPVVTSAKEEERLIQACTKPVVKLLYKRSNNKYSYTSNSDDNLLTRELYFLHSNSDDNLLTLRQTFWKNIELIDPAVSSYNGRFLFSKGRDRRLDLLLGFSDMTPTQEICVWSSTDRDANWQRSAAGRSTDRDANWQRSASGRSTDRDANWQRSASGRSTDRDANWRDRLRVVRTDRDANWQRSAAAGRGRQLAEICFWSFYGQGRQLAEICCWSFYGQRRKLAEVCCTSIVYATEKKQTKVEFPEARIYEETLNALLYETLPVPDDSLLEAARRRHAHSHTHCSFHSEEEEGPTHSGV